MVLLLDVSACSCDEAREEMGRIVLCVENGTLYPGAEDEEQSRLAKGNLDGVYMDMLCDACVLTPVSRCKKWKRESEAARATEEEHMRREEERRREADEKRRFAQREEEIYSSVLRRHRSRQRRGGERGDDDDSCFSSPTPTASWILLSADDLLSSRPPSFWNCVQLSKLSDDAERVAVARRIDLLLLARGKACVPSSFVDQCHQARRQALQREEEEEEEEEDKNPCTGRRFGRRRRASSYRRHHHHHPPTPLSSFLSFWRRPGSKLGSPFHSSLVSLPSFSIRT